MRKIDGFSITTAANARASKWDKGTITICIRRFGEGLCEAHTAFYAALCHSRATMLACEILNELPPGKRKEVENHIENLKPPKRKK